MPLFRREKPNQGQTRPPLKDEALRDLAEMLFDCPGEPTPGLELLDVSKLDFTVESLKHIDDFVDAMRGRPLAGNDLMLFVLRTGAYVGEVIRRGAQGREYHWLDYDAALAVNAQIANLGGKSLGLVAVLWDGGQGLTFPLAKVMKFLQNGREDSVWLFASAMIAKG